ncbi:hypothetical protein AWB69_08278 [Caballeronia udeis]|uniref:Uncharacterized protein n=1 Tax=Caballeronia udeis TaxID=1232866 RepID=A0A158JN62_9BURK|nr:hypothetical protein [Caballeronia udeis]SAL69901.1 hypothetical protein AWB69_08278 [Caballeronia udeis]
MLAKPSVASTSRESGTVFYLNRTLCAHYDLPLQQGGWQDVTAAEMIDWMERGARREAQPNETDRGSFRQTGSEVPVTHGAAEAIVLTREVERDLEQIGDYI